MPFGIQLVEDRSWWVGDNRWSGDPREARPFAVVLEAELAALRELPDPAPAYAVKPLPMEAR